MCFSGICIYKIDDGCAFLSKLVHFSADVNGTAFFLRRRSSARIFSRLSLWRSLSWCHRRLFRTICFDVMQFGAVSFGFIYFNDVSYSGSVFLRLCLLAPVILTRIYIRAKDTCTHKFTDEGSV